jgi:hypothetical protein
VTHADTDHIRAALGHLDRAEQEIRAARAVAGRAITLDQIDKARLHCKALGHDIARAEKGDL